ncbi:methyltransferase [Nocardiopsis sp. CC223A]|uniref:methyltransferase n=1 Tax=Nocardiopsis sp. CC223A TaxID=3044051 RepID=UPI003559024F
MDPEAAPVTSNELPPDAPSARMTGMLSGFAASRAPYAVAGLDLAAKLLAGPRTAADPAEEAGVPEDPLRRVLHTLGGVGAVTYQEGGRRAATSRTRAAGPADRVSAVGGGFSAGVPSADVRLLSAVLHDRSDEDRARLLACITEAARPGARLAAVFGRRAAPGRVERSDHVDGGGRAGTYRVRVHGSSGRCRVRRRQDRRGPGRRHRAVEATLKADRRPHAGSSPGRRPAPSRLLFEADRRTTAPSRRSARPSLPKAAIEHGFPSAAGGTGWPVLSGRSKATGHQPHPAPPGAGTSVPDTYDTKDIP